MMDLEWKNTDPVDGVPQVHISSNSSPLSPLGNSITPIVLDVTAPVADNCINFSAGFLFKMSNLPNMAEFLSSGPPPAGLFEEYKLSKICVEFVPTYQGKDLVTGLESTTPIPGITNTIQRSYPSPTLYAITDHDSSSTINWPMIVEMGGVKRYRLNKNHKIWIDPAVVVPVGQTAGGGSVWSTYKKRPWITNKNLDVVHYGLRILIQDWPGPGDETGIEGDQISYGLRMNIRYYFKCRGTI